MTLEQLLISLAKKQLLIEHLEEQIAEITNKYNELLNLSDGPKLPFPGPDVRNADIMGQ